MSILLKTSDSTYIYFDAVTTYNKTFPSSVTKHPIDGGTNISDHVIDDNMTVSISGIISAADFNGSDRPAFDSDIYNSLMNNSTTNPVYAGKSSKLFDSILSSSILSGKSLNRPNITIDEQDRTEVLNKVKSKLESLAQNTSTLTSRVISISAIDYSSSVLTENIKDLVITSLQFSEDETTGNCLRVDLTLEKVNFVQIKKTTIPQTNTKVKDAATTRKDLGNQIPLQNLGAPLWGGSGKSNKKIYEELSQGL